MLACIVIQHRWLARHAVRPVKGHSWGLVAGFYSGRVKSPSTESPSTACAEAACQVFPTVLSSPFARDAVIFTQAPQPLPRVGAVLY